MPLLKAQLTSNASAKTDLAFLGHDSDVTYDTEVHIEEAGQFLTKLCAVARIVFRESRDQRKTKPHILSNHMRVSECSKP